MNKSELANAVAEISGLTKADSARAIEGVFGAITESLQEGNDVTLVGFGTFKTVQRAARTGRNPRTGEEIKIKASIQPKFSAGKGLKEAVN